MRALLLCVLLLATPAQAADNWIAGRWFGSGQPGDKSQMWVDETAADGTFHVLHRACRQGKAIDSTQEGHWQMKGDMLTIRIEKVDGEPFGRTDIYRILKHSGTMQTYRYEATGFVYNSRRVDGKFQMPPCDLAS